MIRAISDFFFPPICVHCKEAAVKPYFCDACWELSALADPDERCIHCFGSVDRPGSLCSRCIKKPHLPIPRAALFDREAPISRLIYREESIDSFASLAFLQWSKLHLPEPDLIAPIPPSQITIARAFAKLIQKPCPNLFRRTAWPLGVEKWIAKEGLVQEEETVLLFDVGCSLRQLRLASDAILEAFPKKVYVLSLTA
jgi:predicted amidophosphoribosyltransferase